MPLLIHSNQQLNPANPLYSGDIKSAILNAARAGATNELSRLLEILTAQKNTYIGEIAALASDSTLPDPVRVLMIQLLRDLNDPLSLEVLLQLSNTNASPLLRAESLKGLGLRKSEQSEQQLREIANDETDEARAMAVSLLGNRNTSSRTLLIDLVKTAANDEEVLNAALYSLRTYADDEVVKMLITHATNQSNSPRLRATALYSLGVSGNSNGLFAIKANVDSPEREVRYSAVVASSRILDHDLSMKLVGQLGDMGNFPHVRKAASVSLANNATPVVLAELRKAFPSMDDYGAILTSEVFAKATDTESLSLLQERLTLTSDRYAQSKIRDAMAAIKLRNP